MRTFTDSPFERMMQEVPRPERATPREPPVGSLCRGCSYWQGMACIGTCYRDLVIIRTSDQVGPKCSG